MSVSISELEYFLKAAELENITEASNELHIAQPSLSRSISGLEKELGVKLFERTGRNVSLNQYGEVVKQYADRILSELNAMNRELADMTNESDHTVTVAISAASSFLPGIIRRFNSTSKTVRFIVRQHDSIEKNAKADLHIFTQATPVENDYTTTLLAEEVLLAVPSSSPYAERERIRLSDFRDEGFIMLQKGKGLRKLGDYYCQSAHFIPRILLESDSPSTIREYIKCGMGVAFVPKVTWAEVRGEDISLLHIDSPRCVRYICLSWNQSSYLSNDARRFRSFLINHFDEFAKQRAEQYL